MYRGFVALIFVCAIFEVQAEVVFDVEMFRDPLVSRPAYSTDGEVYANLRPGNISIYETRSRKRLGRLCCTKKKSEVHHVYLLGTDRETARIVHVRYEGSDTAKVNSTIALYDLDAKFIKSRVFAGRVLKEQISFSEKSGVFAVRLSKGVYVYSLSDFAEASRLAVVGLGATLGVAVSFEGKSVAYSNGQDIYLYGMYDFQESQVHQCKDMGKKVIGFGFLQPSSEALYLVDQRGKVCLSKGAETIFIKPPGGAGLGVFYDDEDSLLLIINSRGVYVYDSNSGVQLGAFLVEPYYHSIFGIRRHQRPFFVGSPKYDSDTNVLFVSGGTPIGTLFKVLVYREDEGA